MELIYLECMDYRNFKNQKICFDESCKVEIDWEKGRVEINEKPKNKSRYPKYITNINAIVGKNGTGKTNLIELISNRIHYSEENEYILVYRLEEKDRYYIEYSNEKKYKINKIFIPNKDFGFSKYNIELCIYNKRRKKFEIIQEEKYFEDGVDDTIGKMITIQDKENINGYKKDRFLKREAYKYSDANIKDKIKLIYKILKNKERKILKENKYLIDILGGFEIEIARVFDKEKRMEYKDVERIKKLNSEERVAMTVLSSYVKYIIASALNYGKENPDSVEYARIFKEEIIEKVNNLKCNDLIEYYDEILNIGIEEYFNISIRIDIVDKDKKEIVKFRREELKKENKEHYENFKKYILDKKYKYEYDEYGKLKKIYFEITEDTKAEEMDYLVDFLENVFNEEYKGYYDFNGNINYKLNYLSAGEEAYLNILSTLDNRLRDSELKNIILLLDEPENKMHPEMAREFISSLMSFIEDMGYTDKKFQIIISTHSPFMLSDIYSDNVIYLNKEKDNTIVSKQLDKKTFSSNIHKLLSDSFFMDSTMGEYARKKVVEIVDFFENIEGKIEEEQNKEENNTCIDKENNIEIIIEKIRKTIQEYKEIIKEIGEPILRTDIEEFIKNKERVFEEIAKNKK